MDKNNLLKHINNLISVPSVDSENIEKAESLLFDYYNKEKDIDLVYKLAILQLIPPLVDFEKSIDILENYWSESKDIKAIVYIIIIQYINTDIEDKYFDLVQNYTSKDKVLSSYIFYCIGLYYESRNKKENAILYFAEAYSFNSNFTNACVKLGMIYKHTNKKVSEEYFFKAFASIKKIEDNLLNDSYYDWLSIEDFENETILGCLVTIENYDYMKSLAL